MNSTLAVDKGGITSRRALLPGGHATFPPRIVVMVCTSALRFLVDDAIPPSSACRFEAVLFSTIEGVSGKMSTQGWSIEVTKSEGSHHERTSVKAIVGCKWTEVRIRIRNFPSI